MIKLKDLETRSLNAATCILIREVKGDHTHMCTHTHVYTHVRWQCEEGGRDGSGIATKQGMPAAGRGKEKILS